MLMKDARHSSKTLLLRIARLRFALLSWFAVPSAFVLLLGCSLLGCSLLGCSKDPKGNASPAPSATSASEVRKPAPGLGGATAWLNTPKPIELESLRGHVVVLDFWTYACINCLHVLPDLKRLEKKFAGQPLLIIGVHSGKFDLEKQPAQIRAALQRYGVEHPVAVDSQFEIWNAYGVEAWPTLVFIDARGRIARRFRGEPKLSELENTAQRLLSEAAKRGVLTDKPLDVSQRRAPSSEPLAFPGKVAVSTRKTLAVADTQHHRIIISSHSGKVLDIAGSGMAGSVDAAFESAAFQSPQGLAFSEDGQTLYVADTGNHQLRALDLAKRQVKTLAGTGKKARRMQAGPPLSTPLRSPWALALDGDRLFIAMAGSHQIWTYHLRTKTLERFAGSGAEGLEDGLVGIANFAQPSGLALSERTLYVADAEASAIRAIDLTKNVVTTWVGKGLFEFGDRDGPFDSARLQHPLGVAVTNRGVVVADTFNHELKLLDPKARTVTTLTGGTIAELWEPGGLATFSDGRLLIADTNNHRLRVFDPKRKALSDFELRGLEPPTTQGLVVAKTSREKAAPKAVVKLKASGRLGPGAGTLLIDFKAPKSGKLTAGAPLQVSANAHGMQFKKAISKPLDPKDLPVRLPVQVGKNAQGPIEVDLSYYWCTTQDQAVCRPERVTLLIDVELSGASVSREARVEYRPSPH